MAYESQGRTLREVQQYGPSLEGEIRQFLGWDAGKVVYFEDTVKGLRYDVQVDSCYPSKSEPAVFVSVTYCNPDKPGHSNENKLHLKVGELMLLKAAYPGIRSVLVVGGNQHTWLPYVLQVFKYLFDEVIFIWENDAKVRLQHLREDPYSVIPKHEGVWRLLKQEWQTKELWIGQPVRSRLRLGMWEYVKYLHCEGDLPDGIPNSIMRYCMQTAYNVSLKTRNQSGKEWGHFFRKDWTRLWESRSYFNPSEAAIDLTLTKAGFAHRGSLAVDAEVPSLLHSLGGTEVARTKVKEDFVLFSRKRNEPVFIQSKASGGGQEEHGKNIQNRMKEQLTRSLIYRGYINSTGNIELRPQDFVWISILDGNWGVTRSNPLKYMHGLQWGGYQYMIAADSLVDNDYELLPTHNNPLVSILEDLDCYTSQDEFNIVWTNWLAERVRGISDQPEQLLPAIMEPIYSAEQQSFDWDDIASDDGDL